MINMTERDKREIIAALQAVSPSGGGSTPFHLSMLLAKDWGIPQDDEMDRLVMRNCNTVIDDAVEACAIILSYDGRGM